MYFTVVLSLFIISRLSFAHSANELSMKFNPEDSSCSAQCSSCSNADSNNNVPAAGTSGDMSCQKALNQSLVNAMSLKEVKAGMNSMSDVVTDVLNRLEELITVYNESKCEAESGI